MESGSGGRVHGFPGDADKAARAGRRSLYENARLEKRKKFKFADAAV